MNEVNLSVEQFLAAVLYKVGAVELSIAEVMQDYSQYAVAIDPSEETQGVKITLVDLQGVDLEEISE